MILQPVQLPSFSKAQALIDTFIAQSQHASEPERISNAIELSKQWGKKSIPLPIPAIPGRSDYWYLIQLFALQRHVHTDAEPFIWNCSDPETIYITPGIELYRRLSEIAGNVHFENKSLTMSRSEFDSLLVSHGATLVSYCNLSPNEWKLSPMPYDALLRLSTVHELMFPDNIFIDGYRIHTGLETTTGLFGGATNLGGVQYIDSMTLDQPMNIYPYLCIIRKNYGR